MQDRRVSKPSWSAEWSEELRLRYQASQRLLFGCRTWSFGHGISVGGVFVELGNSLRSPPCWGAQTQFGVSKNVRGVLVFNCLVWVCVKGSRPPKGMFATSQLKGTPRDSSKGAPWRLSKSHLSMGIITAPWGLHALIFSVQGGSGGSYPQHLENVRSTFQDLGKT